MRFIQNVQFIPCILVVLFIKFFKITNQFGLIKKLV